MGELAVWLFENAKYMSESMFFDSTNNWQNFYPVNILALRVCTPKEVFTATAKGGYLTRVSGCPELTELTNALFADDLGFINELPETHKNIKSQLKALMQMSYDKKIRPVDSRIKLG